MRRIPGQGEDVLEMLGDGILFGKGFDEVGLGVQGVEQDDGEYECALGGYGVRGEVDRCVFHVWGLGCRARSYTSRAKRSSQNEVFLPRAFELRVLLLRSRSELCFSGLQLVEEEGFESGVFGVDGEAAGAGVQGFGELVEGEEGERGAVVGFDVLGVEAEGGCAVEGCGAVVF